MSDINAVEAVAYYSGALVPILKRKNAEMSITIGEMEATIMLLRNKIESLNSTIESLSKKVGASESSISSSVISSVPNIVEPSQRGRKKKG